MKMKGNPGFGLTIPKRVRIAGMTFYMRNGQVIGRESETHEKRSNTLPQFVQRQKMRHDDAVEDVTLLRHNVHRAAHGISEFRIVGKSVACGIRT